MRIFTKISYFLRYIISPPFCRYCRIFLTQYSVFCDSCKEIIKPIISTDLEIKKEIKLRVHAISNYKEPIKSLILSKSISDYSASIDIAHLIWQLTVLKNIDFDFFVPVPLHWSRYAYRGYNQAQVIAKELAVLSKKPVVSALKRTKRTIFQSMLSGIDRKKNVEEAFVLAISGEKIENKNIVLVDDLMTTGSTLLACAKILMKYNPKSIQAVVACRVI